MRFFFKMFLFVVLTINLMVCSTGCVDNCSLREDDSLDNIVNVNRSRSENEELTLVQLEQLQRFTFINDSILATCNDSVAPLSFWDNVVITSDVKGFVDGAIWGWNGWRQSRSIFSRILNAVAGALICTVIYSIEAAVFSPTPHTSIPPTNTECSYTLPEVYNMVAYVCENDNLDILASNYKNNNLRYVISGTENELQISLIHNQVLKKFDNNFVAPPAKIDAPFTEEQLAMFNDPRTLEYYNDIPNILSGTVSFEEKYGNGVGNKYAQSVTSSYIDGIFALPTGNSNEFGIKIQDLCNAYMREIVKDTTLDQETKSVLISMLYIGPLSYEFWFSDFNSPIE